MITDKRPLGFSVKKKQLKENPFIFFKKILGVETLEDYQKEAIKTIWANDRTAISACHDVGKSFLMARIAMAFLNVYKNSKVITTAPTYNQVERILWSEIRAAHAKAKFPLGGRLNLTDWSFSPDWFALGFTPRNEAGGEDGQGTQSSFQGFHASHLLVIFDEATGIPANVWTMAEGLLTSANVKFVAIGNPTSASSEFYQCFKDPRWAKVYLSCFDSPNLKANGITDLKALSKEIQTISEMNDADAKKYLDAYKVTRPYLLTAKWVVQSAAKWGLDHPLTQSKILGKFPKAGADCLVPLGYVEESQLRVYWPKKTDRKIIGADIARFGNDSTVLTSLHGKKQLARNEFYKFDEIEVTGEIIAMSRAMEGADVIVVDETGLGGGVVTLLKDALKKGDLPKRCEVRGVQFGAKVECDEGGSCDHKACAVSKYANQKARIFGLLQKDLKDDNGLVLLPESIYADELPTIRYRYNQKGQMVIESKDEYKKRTGRNSPDSADSLALANSGNYDEMAIGKFTNAYNTKEGSRSIADSLHSNRKW